MGSAKQPPEQPDCANSFLRGAGQDGASARLYQENAEDAAWRSGIGAGASKGACMVIENPHIGSSLEDFLKSEGMYEDATNYAIKRVIAWQVEEAMREQGITKVEMARRMGTSRAHLNRLLDPNNDKVQLDTVQRAAAAIGRKVRMELI